MKFWKSIKEFFSTKRARLFISNFFRVGTKESMMRLISLTLVVSGITIIAIAVCLEKDGAHYGLELAILGVIGKSYQKGVEKANNEG